MVVYNPPKVTIDIKLAKANMTEAVAAGVRAATLEAEKIMKEDVYGSEPPRHGRVYTHHFFAEVGGKLQFYLDKNGNPRDTHLRGTKADPKPHTASAPGESPAPDTGILRENTQHDFIMTAVGPYGWIFNPLDYSVLLEVGTEKIAPRPAWSRLVTEFKDRIKDAFNKAAADKAKELGLG